MQQDQVEQNLSSVMVLGNEAIALGLIDGGIGYVASYPGTPSTEIMEYLVHHRSEYRYHADWSTNEAVAMEESIAASITGVDSAFISKSVGLNVAMDPLMTIVNSGTEGALVVVVADDPGMHSSQNEQDTRVVGAKFANIPVFEPSTPQEAYYYARKAIEVSRQFKLPVILRSVTRLSHALSPINKEPPQVLRIAEFVPNTRKYVSIPGNARKNHHEMLMTHRNLQEFANKSTFWKELLTAEVPKYLVVTSGNAANYAIEAIQRLELGAHIFVPKMINPLPTEKLRSLIDQYGHVLVIEELEPYLEEELRVLASRNGIEATIVGKDVLTSREGELTIEKISQALILYLDMPDHNTQIDLPVYDDLLRIRPPVLCTGCPHRSTYVELGESLKSFNPIFCNDIGCYSLGVMPPHKSADMLVCMGASIPMATATAITQPDRLAVAIIGDSTFWHTGLPGLANAIWKEANIVVVVVNNSFTAMTGGQPNPSSHDGKLDIARVASSMGAKVYEINPMEYKTSKRVIRNVARESGVRVIVSNYPCALRKDTQDTAQLATTMIVDDDLCTGCELCVSGLGCPALSMNGDIATIDPALCNSCGMCQQVCRYDAIRRID